MGLVNIEFLDELNDFLPQRKRDQLLSCEFNGNPSIKHLIESFGIPHPEVGLILVNERSVDFSYQVQPGDEALIYPASPDFDRLSGLFLEGNLTIEPRFILDNHLGKLATYLRILGFDANYHNDYQDDELAKVTVDEDRILLTRDRQLLMRKTIHYGYWVRSLLPEEQIVEIIRRFALPDLITPFRRCLRCNIPLEPVEKNSILHRLEPLTNKYFREFHACPTCDRIYWKGSHYDRMVKLIARVKIKIYD
jgi:hypothetical protein